MSWLLAHWSQILEVIAAAVALASLVVGMLPESAFKSKAMAAIAWLSALTPRDTVGTFKRPGAKLATAAAVPVAPKSQTIHLGTIKIDTLEVQKAADELARQIELAAERATIVPPAPKDGDQ